MQECECPSNSSQCPPVLQKITALIKMQGMHIPLVDSFHSYTNMSLIKRQTCLPRSQVSWECGYVGEVRLMLLAGCHCVLSSGNLSALCCLRVVVAAVLITCPNPLPRKDEI